MAISTMKAKLDQEQLSAMSLTDDPAVHSVSRAYSHSVE